MSDVAAIMGQSRYKVSVPDEVSGVTDDKSETTRVVKREQNDAANLASLVTHPGWIVLEERIKHDVEQYKSGATLVDLVGTDIGNDKLGEALKIEMKVAARVDNYVKLVHSAFTQIETEKEERRASLRQSRPV